MNNGDSYLESLLSNRKIVRSYKKVNFGTEPLKNIASYQLLQIKILLVGIVAEIPRALVTTFELGRTGAQD